MDILRINPTTFQPDELVEGLTSTVWTERFKGNSEFILKTPVISTTRALIPEGSLISHLETNEVMKVDSHGIAKDAQGNAELTITGRSLTSFAENRVMVADDYGATWMSLLQYTTPGVLSLLVWTYLANPSTVDVTKAVGNISASSAIPGARVVDSTTILPAPKYWSFQTGTLDTVLEEILRVDNFGLRSIRPPVSHGSLIDVLTGPIRGQIVKTPVTALYNLAFEVYQGRHLTRSDTTTPVIFDYQSGHIDDPQYLFSEKDYRNVAIVVSSIGTFEIPITGGLSGLARRELLVDVGSKADETTLADYEALIQQKAKAELAAHNKAVFFDGEISPIAPYRYGIDYALGDFVTLSAEYGFEQTMVVTEYVRTEDQTGDRGYPTLALPV